MTLQRIVAVDWSGVAAGGRKTIWLAEVVHGTLVRLENGRSRSELTDELIAMAGRDGDFVVGLDFAFAFPEWFLDHCQMAGAHAMWRHVAQHGERWLRECEPPFWGRPGKKRPALDTHFRQTELAAAALRSQPKSVFQVGGAGAVGTGSLRGMAQLARLHDAGFAIWPFDAPALPMVVEIYPRLLTGPVVKSDPAARRRYLNERHPAVDDAMRLTAALTEDAFDAAVSALVMWEHREELPSPVSMTDPVTRREGAIWAPTNPRD